VDAPVIAKLFIIIIFIGVVVSLGSALVYLGKDKGGSERMAKALTIRVAISVALFLLLFILWALGIVTPNQV